MRKALFFTNLIISASVFGMNSNTEAGASESSSNQGMIPIESANSEENNDKEKEILTDENPAPTLKDIFRLMLRAIDDAKQVHQMAENLKQVQAWGIEQQKLIEEKDGTIRLLEQRLYNANQQNWSKQQEIERLNKKHENSDQDPSSSEKRRKLGQAEKSQNAEEQEANRISLQQAQEQLFQSTKEGNLSGVINAIKDCADINKKDKEGFPPLCMAARKGHTNIVKYLVEHNAHINKTDSYKRTPLCLAARNGYKDVVKYLIEQKAYVDKSDENRRTPLFSAAKNGHLDIVKYLVEHNAYINKADSDGRTPLAIAAYQGHENIVKYLVEHRARINTVNEQNITPLWDAAYNGHINIVRYLVEHGAEINVPKRISLSPLLFIEMIQDRQAFSEKRKQNYQEIINYLKSKGAKSYVYYM